MAKGNADHPEQYMIWDICIVFWWYMYCVLVKEHINVRCTFKGETNMWHLYMDFHSNLFGVCVFFKGVRWMVNENGQSEWKGLYSNVFWIIVYWVSAWNHENTHYCICWWCCSTNIWQVQSLTTSFIWK